MSAVDTLERIIKALLKTHPNAALPIQELYDNSADKREKEKIKAIAWGFGIEINEEEN